MSASPSSSPRQRRIFAARPLAAAVLLAALAACGGGSSGNKHDHSHDKIRIDTQGRLALIEKDSPVVRIYDLDEGKVEARHTLAAAPSSIYASPGNRYALAMQRADNRVQFVDGGIWQEDHGDHQHDYRQASRLLGWQLNGPKPTHYNPMANGHASIFMDGQAAATPQENAVVQVVSDDSIGKNKTLATVALGSPMHGLAQSFDDLLVVPMRSKPATENDVLPDRLQVYQRTNQNYQLASTLETPCERMHGGGSSDNYTVVGCGDGGLLLTRNGSKFTQTPLKLPNRLAAIISHKAVPGQLVGFGNSRSPFTTHFYAIDGAKGSATPIMPEGWGPGTTRRASVFDRRGRLLILDNKGTLYTLQFADGSWKTIKRTADFVAMPEKSPWPGLASSAERDNAFVTDPASRQILTVASDSHQITRRDNLDFSPAGMVWLGIAR